MDRFHTCLTDSSERRSPHVAAIDVELAGAALRGRPDAKVMDVCGANNIPERQVRRWHGSADTHEGKHLPVKVGDEIVSEPLCLARALLVAPGDGDGQPGPDYGDEFSYLVLPLPHGAVHCPEPVEYGLALIFAGRKNGKVDFADDRFEVQLHDTRPWARPVAEPLRPQFAAATDGEARRAWQTGREPNLPLQYGAPSLCAQTQSRSLRRDGWRPGGRGVVELAQALPQVRILNGNQYLGLPRR
jgi:hypothetical protein